MKRGFGVLCVWRVWRGFGVWRGVFVGFVLGLVPRCVVFRRDVALRCVTERHCVYDEGRAVPMRGYWIVVGLRYF